MLEIVERMPAHDCVHGFRRGRSILSYAAPHVGRRIVLRFDLRDFFPSIPSSRVHALFRTIGYPVVVARLLTGLCTNAVPEDVWGPGAGDWRQRRHYRYPHLPQGAPTSPALANLGAHHF